MDAAGVGCAVDGAGRDAVGTRRRRPPRGPGRLHDRATTGRRRAAAIATDLAAPRPAAGAPTPVDDADPAERLAPPGRRGRPGDRERRVARERHRLSLRGADRYRAHAGPG